jgi:hypothetical protein
MEKTELLFFVAPSWKGWIVRSESQTYGPFDSYSTAFHEAVEEAQAAGLYGFASAVLVQPSAGGPFGVQWAYGRDAYSPSALLSH